ncbi:hypothetical protein EVAR_31788_1 [Eumeta japonica]|uniref:Uncharacterized protein n=1 Tax=Eumeta variegata TaxID=151549 RepID=A0A4C1W5S0_EUMVA|nr:hypothetical protein EVAR_31788_1 [Eumeta japonica]
MLTARRLHIYRRASVALACRRPRRAAPLFDVREHIEIYELCAVMLEKGRGRTAASSRRSCSVWVIGNTAFARESLCYH